MNRAYLVIRVREGTPPVVVWVEHSLKDAENTLKSLQDWYQLSQLYIQEVYGY